MLSRIGALTLVGVSLGAPCSLMAQTSTIATTITFIVPVNLTQLSPEITKVRVGCAIAPSSALVYPTNNTGPSPNVEEEMDVTSGQMVTAFRVIMPIYSSWLQDPVGKQASYGCALEGYAKGRWDRFKDTHADPAWRLTPTPETIWGTFTW